MINSHINKKDKKKINSFHSNEMIFLPEEKQKKIIAGDQNRLESYDKIRSTNKMYSILIYLISQETKKKRRETSINVYHHTPLVKLM